LTNLRPSLSDTSSSSLPRRGEKDFEPNPTEFQADVLSASRGAMHNALAHPRIHQPKNQVIGIYAPDGPAPPPQVKVDEKGTGVSSDYCVCVPIPKGQYFKTVGQADRWNRTWLLPEEAMYLLERGSLDIKWPRELSGIDADDVNEPLIPMSLQAAYACLLGRSGLTLERYTVYTGLKRLGYAVVRAPGWDDTASPENSKEEANKNAYTQPQQRGPGLAGIIGRCFAWLDDPFGTSSTAAGPIVGCGIHRNYSMFLCPRIMNHLLIIHSRCIPQARNHSLVRPGKGRDKRPYRHGYSFSGDLPRLQALYPDQKIRLAGS
jgi:tRNA-splicing endonuclease subunit Sen54